MKNIIQHPGFDVFSTGMVSICAGCNLYEPWAAGIVAIIAGILYVFFSRMMLSFKVTLEEFLSTLSNFSRLTIHWMQWRFTRVPDVGAFLLHPSSSRVGSFSGEESLR